jgi:hypothetical protein
MGQYGRRSVPVLKTIDALHAFALGVHRSRLKEIQRQHPSWRATGGRCFYCGEPACVLDHRIPKRLGGDDQASNRTPACWECNSAKSGNTLEDFRMIRAEAMGVWCRFTPVQRAYLATLGCVPPEAPPSDVFWGDRR